MNKETIISITWLVVIVAIISLSVWWNLQVFEECRQTNSFGYCLRLITK
jgi:hypothetical protein